MARIWIKKIFKHNGVTLLEMMVVLAIFVGLFSAIVTILTSSDRSWRIGQSKLQEQRSARVAIDTIGRYLRQSNPDWVISGNHYPITITSAERLDFYQPLFDTNGNITTLQKVTFKRNVSDATQLLMKVGTQPSVLVTDHIQSISFSGGCAGCAVFNCTAVASDCPVVLVSITTRQDNDFTLVSKINIRNWSVPLDSSTSIEEPTAGEF
ncbi:MAG: type II secretion system protein [Candidatus Omnitrophota bacterium]|jgi:prepilin-type N-terminal cleavage/methylation domain-containing protein